MLHSDSFEALTNNGIHYLFGDNFEGQQFTLQFISFMPPPQAHQPFRVFLSDGCAWIRGELVDEAKRQAQSSSEMHTFTVVRFCSQHIRVNHEDYTFKLGKILESKTTIHNLIGEPIPYQDFKKKGLTNNLGTNIISNPATVFSIREVKEMPTGKITGAVVGKVIRRPRKVNKSMNIVIEDRERQQIQCCFFVKLLEYQEKIREGVWYRFEDPVLQINNVHKTLELKINQHSSVARYKVEGEKEEEQFIGILKPIQTYRQDNKEPVPRTGGHPEVEFIPRAFEELTDIPDADYWIVARVQKITPIKDKGRSLTCVDKTGYELEITLWSQFQGIDIVPFETYRFGRMRAKSFRNQLSLHSRKRFTYVTVSEDKIINREQIGKKRPLGDTPYKLKEKTLSDNDIIYSLTEMMEQSLETKEKCYCLVLARLFVKLEFRGVENDFLAELKKKLFYTRCDRCESADYIRSTKVEPELVNEELSCSGCKTNDIKVIWNIKASLADCEEEIACKINSEIVEKMIGINPIEGYKTLLTQPDQLKKYLVDTLNFHRGVFKINAKVNSKKEGQRFYNICEYYPNALKAYLNQTAVTLKQAEDAYRHYCHPKHSATYPLPSFLSRPPLRDEQQL